MKNKHGFAIVEVLVAAALLGGVALAISKLTQDQLKSTKTVETRFEYNSILNDIREILGDRASCTATFLNQNALTLAPGTVTRMREVRSGIPTPTTVEKYISNTNYASAPQYGAGGTIRILSYRLSATDVDSTIGFPATSRTGSTNLYVKFAFGTDKTYSSNTLERKIRLNVTTISTADRRIEDCSSTGAMADYESRYVNVTGDYMTGPLEMRNGSRIDMLSGTYMDLRDNADIRFTSDGRLKKDVKNIRQALTKIKKLRPVTYRWKSNDEMDQGLIAQEVQKVYPELVLENDRGFLSVNYIMLTPMLIRSVQELDDENRSLKKDLAQLKNEQKKVNQLLKNLREDMCSENPQAASCK